MICGCQRRYGARRNFVQTLTRLIDCGVLGGTTSLGSAAPKTHDDRVVKLRGRLGVGLPGRGGGEDRRLLDAKGELVAVEDGALVCLFDTLLFGGALANDLSGMIVFEIGCPKVLDTPDDGRQNGLIFRVRAKGWYFEETDLPFSLSSLSPMHFESFLNSRFDLALSESTIRDWTCHNLQLKFSSLCPCSR